ncbi:MAG TPA: hypothetical protein VF775_06870 [Geobacteraceae bacterium]
MLVFLSDVHLTDGSSGETIRPAAFKLFADNLLKLAETVSPLEELRLILLGDIFDIIRSSRWLDGGNGVRPWDGPSPQQEEIVGNILRDILTANGASLAEFDRLRDYAGKRGIPFGITYVIGNHDWLVNRYPGCREMAANALGIPSADAPPFPTELFEPGYRVFARHGDIYDKFNYMGNRDASSIGDAIVIELLNKYPLVAGEKLDGLVATGRLPRDERDRIFAQLKELDNIRPLLDAPSWVLMVSDRAGSAEARQAITDAWEECVNQFFHVPFISKQDKFLWPDTIDLLQIALRLSSHTSKRLLEKLVELKERFVADNGEGGYAKAAFAEAKVRSGEAGYVLYGHTHEHLILPMDQVPLERGSTLDKVYFNTGTWRKTWNKACFEHVGREFIGWQVLTYVTIYRPTENRQYNFEVWNGALG